jgi:hypothetical protein
MSKTKEFKVTWQIDVDATDHTEAAKIAQDMMRDAGAGWFFMVKQLGRRNATEKQVDLATTKAQGERP